MTDAILGHDCNGRELRAGDRVVYEGEVSKDAGESFTILRAFDPESEDPGVGHDMVRLYGEGWCVLDDEEIAQCCDLRLINSGRELFDQCAREADKMPTESTIRQRMPDKEEL